MSPQVLDYSFARPSPASIKGAGFVGVMRYLSGGANAKDLTAGERDALFGAGLDVGLVWETTATRMNAGYAAGQSDATVANAQADRLGFPGDRPIYFANDQNAADPAHVDYMRGARDTSPRPVGPYGSTALVDRCASLGCRYGWKVSTWGPPTPNACLVQEANARSPIAGTDVNSVTRADWGQWHGSSEDDMTKEEHDALMAMAQRVAQLQAERGKITDQFQMDQLASAVEAAQTADAALTNPDGGVLARLAAIEKKLGV